MANLRFLQNVKNSIPIFKNVSTNFILLASLLILSILVYYMFNKRNLENMDTNVAFTDILSAASNKAKDANPSI